MGKSDPLLAEPSGLIVSLLCSASLLAHIATGYSLVVVSPAFFFIPSEVRDFTSSRQGLAVFLYTVAAMLGSAT